MGSVIMSALQIDHVMEKSNCRNALIISSLVLLLMLPALIVSTSAFSIGTSTNLSNDSFNATYPNIQNVGSNVYAAWSEGSHGVLFRESLDGGQTWSTPVSLATRQTSFPEVTATGSDVYVVWTVNGSLSVAISVNNGSSFTTKTVSGTVTGCQTPATASYGSDVYVTADCSGHSYITSSSNSGSTWTTLTEYASGPEPEVAAYGHDAYAVSDTSTRGKGAVYYTNNDGLTWSSAGAISGAEKWVSAYGSSAVVASETKGTASVVEVISTTNAGKTWTSSFTLSASIPDSWAPMTGIFGNTQYVAWRSHPGSSSSQEYVSVSTDAGKNWSSPITIGIARHDNSWPVTVATVSSTAFIAWYEKTGTSSSSLWQAVAVEGTNNGTTWSSPIVLGHSLPESDVATEAISTNGTQMFAVWTNTTVSGNTQVYYATASA
jgi:hypothetical protein